LLTAIDEQMSRGKAFKGEYYLADAINIMLERGLEMKARTVDVWLDAGTPESLLDTNRYLLENGLDNNHAASQHKGIVVIPPVFIHPSARVVNSVIGPYTSLGAECQVYSSIIRNSILADAAEVTDVILEGSLVGRKAQIRRRPVTINAGDQTLVTF
jgi:glucose-1-phosphate thymidylyltransferase